jgi:hypothetical protein
MRLVSSKTTFFNKRVFPVIWFGFIAVFIGLAFFSGAGRNAASPLPFLIGPAIMIVFGYVIMKKLVFDLADEVWDDGGSLVVKNSGQEQRIALSDIKNVSHAPFINPPGVTLSLRRPTVFGDEITFSAPVRLVPFSKSPVITDLIERVDLARSKRG